MISMNKITLPAIARFKVPVSKTNSHELPSFPYQKILEQRGHCIIVKFYDYNLKATFVEKITLYTFQHLIIGDFKQNIPKSTFIYTDYEGDRKWINLWQVQYMIEIPESEPNYYPSVEHADFCMVWPEAEKEHFTKESFIGLTGEPGQVKNLYSIGNTEKKEQNPQIDITLPAVQPPKMSEEESSSKEKSDSSDSEEEQIMETKQKKSVNMFETRKKKPIVRYEIEEWDDIYQREEKKEPTQIPKLKNCLLVNFAKDRIVKTVKLEIYTLSCALMEQWDDQIVSISGNKKNQNNNNLRSFMCLFFSKIYESKYTEWKEETGNNLYYILVCDVYCRFLGIARPKSVQWMLCNDPDKWRDVKERIPQEISYTEMKEFVEELNMTEYYEDNTLTGPQNTINSQEFWKWMMKKLAEFYGEEVLYIHPRVAVVLRRLIARKLIESK